MKMILFVLLSLGITVNYIYADWTKLHGPFSGDVDKVAIDRSINDIMFAKLGFNIHKTVNRGNEWYQISNNATYGFFEIAPSDHNVIYTYEFKSTDGGESWFSITPIPFSMGAHDLSEIKIHPTNPEIIFSAGYFKIHRSDDGGTSWTEVLNDFATSIAFNEDNNATIYALRFDFFKSTDNGNNWSLISNVSNNFGSGASLIHHEEKLYARASRLNNQYVYNKIIKSTDEGLTWSNLNLDSTHYGVTKINDLTIENNIIYAATDKGLYISADDGVTWERISSDSDYIKCVDIHNKILVGSSQTGVSVSPLSVYEWTNIGIVPISNSSTIVTADNSLTYLVDRDNGLYRLKSDNMHWKTNMPPSGSSVASTSFGISKQNSNKVFCIHGNALFESTDAGLNWTYKSSVPSTYGNLIHLSNDENKFFIKSNPNIVRSLNGGNTWSVKPTPSGFLKDLHYSSIDILYILTEDGFYYSTNDGNTWSNLDAGLPQGSTIEPTIFKIFYDKSEDDRIFCVVYVPAPNFEYIVYEKLSGSTTWSLLYSAPFNGTVPIITGNILTYPANSNIIYARGNWMDFSQWLLRSNDGGTTWERVSNFGTLNNERDFFNYSPYYFYSMENDGVWVQDVQNLVVGIQDPDYSKLINKFIVKQNYPNPFNPSTKIEFYLPENNNVKIQIYNSIGQQIDVINLGMKTKNWHTITWNSRNFPSGIYFYLIKTDNYQIGKKMLLLR